MKQDDLFTLLESLSHTDKLQESTDNLKQALLDLGLDHISYFAANIPTQKSTQPLLTVTYAPEWQRHYYQNNYIDIDPVVRAGLGGFFLSIGRMSIARSVSCNAFSARHRILISAIKACHFLSAGE